MNNQSRSLLASASPRIQAALQDYLDRVDKGEPIDAEAFLIRHAEIADELRSFIAIDQQARQLAGAGTPKAGSPGPEKIEGKSPQTKAEVSTHSVVGNIEGTVGGKRKTPDIAAPVASDARSPGDLPDVFGRYRVQKKLGSGAMGAVYLADDTLLHRRVALKTPTFENDQDGELLRRFYREARAVANLKHPNLCAVYDVGETDGRHYISMEFVRGKKLQDYIKPDKPMAEKQVMAVVRKIALAMHDAHTHGVIHRDLKPDNIMVNEKGEPVVMDFGLVHKTESKNSTRITQRGMLVGSPAYMSKEQVEGDSEKLTGATDQYSLGVILYQLLTSRLPFEGGIHGVLAAILTKEPTPPSQIRVEVNPHLEAVCLKMMAKDAKDRYPSMKAVADAILEVSKGTSKAAGSVAVAEPAAQSLAEGLTATIAGVSIAADQPLPALTVRDSFLKSRIRRTNQKGSNGLLFVGLVSVLFLLLSVILWIRSGQALVKVTVNADDVEVTFQNNTISIVDGSREYKVAPGEHVLHIKSKDAEFDTDKFTLKRGENPVVIVEVVDAAIVVKLGDDVISPRRKSEDVAAAKVNSLTPEMQPSNDSDGEATNPSHPRPPGLNPAEMPQADSSSKVSSAKTDYDRIATGKWLRIVDSSTPLPNPEKMVFTNGVLELRSTTLVIDTVSARNIILRAKVNKISGSNTALSVRQAQKWHNYSGYFAGGNTYGMGKVGAKPWADLFRGSVGTPKSGFFEMGVSMVDDTLTLYADGKTIHSLKDTEHERGTVNLIAESGVAQFRDVEVMVLDPVSVQDSTTTPQASLVDASMPQLLRITDADDKTSLQASAWVSSDGLRMYWEQLDKPDEVYQIWQAERANAEEPFGNKRVVGTGRQPTLTPDELQMVVTDTVGQNFKRLYTASRKTTSTPFGSTEPLTQFGDNICNSPSISADGLAMTTNARPVAATTIFPVQYLISRRKKLTDPWSAPVALDIRWDAVAQQCPLTWITMAPDELSFLATHELDLGRFQVVQFTRSKTSEPFETFTYLSLPRFGPVHGRTPRYVPATQELFLTAPDDYSKATTLAGWQDSHRPVLWVIRNVDLSISKESVVAAADALPQVSIPDDATAFGEHAYKFFDEQLTWKEARARCESLGGNLAIIDDAEENNFIGSLVAKSGSENSWIGITDEVSEGQWLTVAGTPVSFTNWLKPHEPDNTSGEEHFALISNRLREGKRSAWQWHDQPDQAETHLAPGYVCEWDSELKPDSIAEQEQTSTANKWVSVFNGKDLTGWTPMLTTGANNEIQSPTTLGWRVQKNEIVCETDTGGWLRLDKEYGDCEIEFEFLVPKKMNAGLLVHNLGQGALFGDHLCVIQLKNDQSQSEPAHACGAICGIVPPTRNVVKRNTWNKVSVRVQDLTITVSLNSETVVDAKIQDYPTLQRLATSGYFGFINFKGLAKGCRFRNIRVLDLTKTVAALPTTPESPVTVQADSPPSDDSVPTTTIPNPDRNDVATSDWVDLLEWSEGIDWKSRGYDWSENCEGMPGKAGITLKPTKGLQNIFPLPAIIDGDYDMEVEFTRHEGRHSVETLFPVGTKNLQLLLGGYSGKVEGVFGEDGNNLLAESSLGSRTPLTITNHEKHRVAIRVRQTEPQVRLEIDVDQHKNYFTWSGQRAELDPSLGGRQLTTIRRPWIAGYESRVTFDKLRVKMISGTISKDFITQADRDADLANGFVRLVGEPAIKPVVGFARFCVNQLELSDAPDLRWPLITRDFAPCRDFYGAHAPSSLKCPIPKGARSFTVVGYNDASRSTKYVVFVDGKEIYASGVTGIVPIRIDLPRDAGLLELVVETGGNPAFDCSYWCYPRFHANSLEKVTERMLDEKSPTLKFKIGSHTVGDDKLTYNQPFSFCRSIPVDFRDARPCDEFLYAVPNSSVTYAVAAGMTRFTAIAYCVVSHHARFEVWADAQQIFTSPQAGIIPIDLKLPPDTKTLELKINDLGTNVEDHCMWCYPRLHRK